MTVDPNPDGPGAQAPDAGRAGDTEHAPAPARSRSRPHAQAEARARVADAHALADAWDAAAGVRTRPAEVGDLDGIVERMEATWGPGRSPDRAFLRALSHAGSTVLVAVPADGAPDPAAVPLGAAVGFLGWSDGLHLHSHMNAVDPSSRGHGIGVALKLRQRAACLEHGVDEIRWTFDPLIRRNAYFNLVRLGAEVAAYHRDFYGDLRDAISGGDVSDRFEVRWRLDAPRTRRALAHGPDLVRAAAGARPRRRRHWPAWAADGEALELVADFEAVRIESPVVAAELRARSRTVFDDAFARGLRPELVVSGDYVFTADDPDREA
ncbi:hypothetical protein ACDF64_09915 [Agromyces sp. MMS24-JH15]|uniref:hypothetical protein n=1 Tax=Agromyces sp. MMS24-JH15 TaxID=3243765 RepID=UPI00374881A4